MQRSPLEKIQLMLCQIRQSIKYQKRILPLVKCKYSFDIAKLRYQPDTNDSNNMSLSKQSLHQIVRLVEILTISKKMIQQNKIITKRNVFYQLCKYYPYYQSIDCDIKILTDSLRIPRHQLNIVASGSLLLFVVGFNLKIRIRSASSPITQHQQLNQKINDKKLEQETFQRQLKEKQNQQYFTTSKEEQRIGDNIVQIMPRSILKVPNCQTIKVNFLLAYFTQIIMNSGTDCSNKASTCVKKMILIIEKESMLQALAQSSYFLQVKNQAENWILITGKGYPDQITKQFLANISQAYEDSCQIYYLGDYDVYGIDIMLNYSIGDQYYRGIWDRINWLSGLNQIIQIQCVSKRLINFATTQQFRKSECSPISQDGFRKASVILNRKQFNLTTEHFGENSENQVIFHQGKHSNTHLKFIHKMQKIKNAIEKLLDNNINCELQSYVKCFNDPMELVLLMIQNKLYI